MLLVYPERLGRSIGEEVFEQLASVINFRVRGVKNPVDKYRISIARGRFIKDYLWRKIEVGTLYYSQKSRLTTPPIIACKHQNIVNLLEFILARDVVFCISSSM